MNTKDNPNTKVFNEGINSEKEIVCSRQKPSIPSLLRQVVPDEMEIIPVGPGSDGRPILKTLSVAQPRI